jgi:hypothetical protein
MESYIDIEFVEGEPSKIRVKAANGFYSGYTEQYINSERLSNLAKELTGFPNNLKSVVVFESDPGKKEKSDFYLKFFCKDNICHTAVRVVMKTGLYSDEISDEAKFEIKFEAAALDRFVSSLKTIIKNGQGIINLTGVVKNS